jgi:hypothetical protein
MNIRGYIHRLADDYKAHTSASGAPYIRQWPTCQIRAPPLRPDIFVGDVSPMNVTGYICRFHITDKYIVTFVGTNE